MAIDVDKLIFTLDGDLTPLRQKYAQAELDAAASGKKIQAALSATPNTAAAGQLSAINQALGSYSSTLRGGTGATNELTSATGKLTDAHGNLHGEIKETDRLLAALAQGNLLRSVGGFTLLSESMLGLGAAGLAAAAGGAALVGVFVAAESRLEGLNEQAKSFDTIIKGVGSGGGLNATGVQNSVQSVARSGPFSEDDVGKAADALLRLHTVGAETFNTLLPLAEDYAKVTGEDLPAAAAKLGSAYSGNFDAIKQLDQSLNLLSRDQLNVIRNLEQQGKATEAGNIVIQAMQDRINGLAKGSMTDWETETKKLGNAWRDFEDSIASTGAIGLAASALKKVADAIHSVSEEINGLKSGDIGSIMQAIGQALQLVPGMQGAGRLLSSGGSAMQQPAGPTDAVGGGGVSFHTGLGGDAGADAQAHKALVVDFDAALETEQRQLNATQSALETVIKSHGDLGAAELEAKLSSDALTKSILGEEQKHISAAVATQRHIDFLKDLLNIEAQQRTASMENTAAQRTLQASTQGPGARNVAEATNQANRIVAPALRMATSQEEVNLLTKKRDALISIYTVTGQVNSETRNNDDNRQLQQDIDLKELQLSLVGQSRDATEQETAVLKAKFALENEGIDQANVGYQKLLETKTKLMVQDASLDAALKKAEASQQALQQAGQQVGDVFSSAFEKIASNTKDWRTVLADIPAQLEQIALKLLVIQPLEQAIFGSKGAGGGVLSSGGGLQGLINFLGFGPSLASGGSAASAGTTGVPGLFAGGGPVGSDPIIVGEGGKELWVPPVGGGTIISAPETKRALGRSGGVNIVQQISVHPDVSQVARAEIARNMGTIRAAAIAGVATAQARGNVRFKQ